MNKIKMTLTIASIVALGFKKINAQAFDTGTSVVTVGYGFPNLVKSLLKTAVKTANDNGAQNSNVALSVKGFGPVLGKYEYGISKVVGVGAVVGYFNAGLRATSTYEDTRYNNTTGQYETGLYTDVAEANFTSLSFGARMNFHFAGQGKLDPYAGIAAGYSANKYTITYSSTNPDYVQPPSSVSFTGIPVYFGLTVGMRYYFSENIGAYTELGIDKASIIQGGIALKF